MTKEELIERYRQFALRIIKLVNSMPNNIAGLAIARQIIRSGTSPSANYRAACLAKSDRDFLNKLKMVEEEIDETSHWLSLIIDSEMLPKYRVQDLYDESVELRRITAKAILTTKNKIEAAERDKL
ncbi:MAG: four helix bundle protein [Paludibacteraceae bacterium]|nr:four helix bundle protein [Paludibacteraceae bacterium]MBQ2189521.1 four helix bundle protein [Paludibacteraceae bacterium]MBQ2520310.1 four helix bundle protein [Paludibacteraceae bacterium]MBQ4018470.1 four helix bundle protein [Paludibacteraceae bacterium]MBQ5378717.1 four helix bundle protein [Paludibacteraceae bacterium]